MAEYTPPAVSELARRIVDTEDQQSDHTPQLAYSSIEGGAIDEYDDEGTLSSVIGEQWDGTHAAVSYAGPKPPVPSGFTVTPGPLSVSARWNGTFADGALSPMDLKHAEVEMATDAAFTDLKRVTLTGELGTEAVIGGLDDTITYWFRLVVRTLSGKASDPSTEIAVTPGAAVAPGTMMTGVEIETHEAPNTGIKINEAGSNSIEMFNPNGMRTLLADGDTGQFVAVGSLVTDLAGARVEVTDRENETEGRGIAAVDLYADDTTNHGALYTEQGITGDQHTTVLGHFITENFQTARLKLREDGYFELSGPAQDSAIWGAAGFMSLRSSDMNFITRSEFHDNVVVTAGTDGPEVFAAFNDANYPNGTLRSRPTYDNTTGTSANMVVGSGGMIQRSTSLSEHKIAIEYDWEAKGVWRQVKDLNPITFYDKANAERYAALESGEDVTNADYPMEILGLLAEDVQEAMPVLNTYGDHGDLNGVAYDRIPVALIPWLKEHDQQIAELQSRAEAAEKRADALEARIAALETK